MEMNDLRTKVLFYGIWSDDGHFLHFPGGDAVGQRRRELPQELQYPDGTFCRPIQAQGICRINFVEGWTILSFWDRSAIDKRPGCNSNFMAFGRHNFEAMKKLIEINYPSIVKRWTFPLILEGMDIAEAVLCVFCETAKAEKPLNPEWIVNGQLCCNYHLPGLLIRDGRKNEVAGIQ